MKLVDGSMTQPINDLIAELMNEFMMMLVVETMRLLCIFNCFAALLLLFLGPCLANSKKFAVEDKLLEDAAEDIMLLVLILGALRSYRHLLLLRVLIYCNSECVCATSLTKGTLILFFGWSRLL
jgi:hypothetical protein